MNALSFGGGSFPIDYSNNGTSAFALARDKLNSFMATPTGSQNPYKDGNAPDSTALDNLVATTSGSQNRPYGGSSPVNSSSQLDYYLADIAKRYGMDKATAYQEALSNSSYQRAVADLRAAGLNPVLALGKVTPAASFSGSYESSGGGGVSRRSTQSTDWVNLIGQVAKVATSAASIMRVVSML